MDQLFLDGRLRVTVADITTLAVDLIVNAANSALCGGGGVDGAIHRAAGPELLAECRTLGGAKPGDVKLTRAYRLPAKFIAHAVGPVWDGGARGENETLARCYRGALALAVKEQLTTVAFPSISTGAYRFPLERAADVATQTIADVLAKEPSLTQVTLCCFSGSDARVYASAAEQLVAPTKQNTRP